MTKDQLDEASENLDESMSTIILAASSLETICDSLLNGQENEHGYILVYKSRKDALTFLASHFHGLVRDHVKLWDSFRDDLRKGESNAPA